MLQLVLVLIIVFSAAGIAVYRIVVNLRNPLRGCDGCDKYCGGCQLEDLKNQLEAKQKSGGS